MALIDVVDLSISVGENVILDHANLSIEEGQTVILSGDNGSGKSTLLKAIFGERSGLNIKGDIRYRGNEIASRDFDLQNYRKRIGYVPQEDSFCEETPFKEACYSYELHCGTRDEDYINSLFDKFGIPYLKNKKLFSKRGPQLSGGEKKMAALIATLCRKNSDLFLIDEPLNNLDAKNVRTISNMINSIHENNPKAGVLIVTHCHALPRINKQYQIAQKKIEPIVDEYKCFNCFGPVDENGFYRF